MQNKFEPISVVSNITLGLDLGWFFVFVYGFGLILGSEYIFEIYFWVLEVLVCVDNKVPEYSTQDTGSKGTFQVMVRVRD